MAFLTLHYNFPCVKDVIKDFQTHVQIHPDPKQAYPGRESSLDLPALEAHAVPLIQDNELIVSRTSKNIVFR